MHASVLVVLALLLLPALPIEPAAAGPERASGICGRADYPDVASYDDDSVVNASLWRSLREAGGFANGTEGMGSVEFRADDGSTLYVVRLEEITVRRYVGGTATDVTVLALRVREEAPAGQVRRLHNFTFVDPGRAGGNLTLTAWTSGGGLEVFWRWAYLECDDAFPNLYYVFHGQIAPAAITDDNRLVYFESSRPRRGPPVDLILLITAGIAASAIFLLARRALKGPRKGSRDSDERTIK